MVVQNVLLVSLLKDVWVYVWLSLLLFILSPVFVFALPCVSVPVSFQSVLVLFLCSFPFLLSELLILGARDGGLCPGIRP